MCINKMHAINPGFITLLQLWKNGPHSSTKNGKDKRPKFSSDNILIQGQYLKCLGDCGLGMDQLEQALLKQLE